MIHLIPIIGLALNARRTQIEAERAQAEEADRAARRWAEITEREARRVAELAREQARIARERALARAMVLLPVISIAYLLAIGCGGLFIQSGLTRTHILPILWGRQATIALGSATILAASIATFVAWRRVLRMLG